MQHLPEEAPALAAAIGISPAQGAGQRVRRPAVVGVGIPQPGHHIPRCQQPQPDDGRVRGFVKDPVHLAGREPAVQRDVRRIGNPTPVDQPGEGPPGAGDDVLRPVFVFLHRQHRIPAFQVIGGIRLMLPVGQKLRRRRRGGLEGNDDGAGHRRTVGPECVGDAAPEQPRRVGNVVLPAAPDQAVAAAHQEPVARMRVGIGRAVRGAVKIFQRQFPAPVRHVQQQPAVAVVVVHRLDDTKVGGEFHQAGGVARCQANIGDDCVVAVFRVNGEARRPVQLLVSPNFSKRLPGGESPPRADFQCG